MIPSHEKPNSLTLSCFSPPVMLATMIIETALAIYVLVKYRRGAFAKISAALIITLGVFQFSEYQICSNQHSQLWAKLGLAAISLLPILGLELVDLITKKRRFLIVGCIAAALLVSLFIFFPQSVAGSYCGGNYVIFDGPTALYEFFGAYYFAFLIFAIWESIEAMHENQSKRLHRVLRWIVIGYLSFMLPMIIIYVVYAPARVAVTSIMCGFAVLLAFILAFQIVPKYYTLKRTV